MTTHQKTSGTPYHYPGTNYHNHYLKRVLDQKYKGDHGSMRTRMNTKFEKDPLIWILCW